MDEQELRNFLGGEYPQSLSYQRRIKNDWNYFQGHSKFIGLTRKVLFTTEIVGF